MGQPIGRLPKKETTKHVPVHRQPSGAVNFSNQLKTMSPETGLTRWIETGSGLVRDNQGSPANARSAK